jgi:hypothetical protein
MNRILFIIILLLSIQKTFQQQNTNTSLYEQTNYNNHDDSIFILRFVILISSIIYF